MYPSDDEIVALHKKHATSSDAFERIYGHSVIVRDIALDLIKSNALKVDTRLVEAGALLHDIGTYGLYKNGTFDKQNYVTHGIRGHQIMREEGYPERLARIASHHTGMGLTKAGIIQENLPLPEQDYLAETIEERLVMYADKFHSKTPKFNTPETYMAFSQRFGKEVGQKFQEMMDEFGLPDLNYYSTKYGDPIK